MGVVALAEQNVGGGGGGGAVNVEEAARPAAVSPCPDFVCKD